MRGGEKVKVRKFAKKVTAGLGALAALVGNVLPAAAVNKAVTNAVSTEKLPYTDLGAIISTLLQAALIIAGLGAFTFLILGGFQYVTSGGDKIQAEAARDKITYAIIGLVIIVGSYAGIRVIETLFGVSIVSGINWPGPEQWAGQ